MSDTIQLGGGAVLQAGPAAVDDCGSFPAGATSIPLQLLPVAKGYVVTTGRQLYNLSSPSAFTTLPGVGALGPVTKAHTLYLRCLSPFEIRITNATDGTTKVNYVMGLFLQELTQGQEVVLVEAMGAGQLELLAAGNA